MAMDTKRLLNFLKTKIYKLCSIISPRLLNFLKTKIRYAMGNVTVGAVAFFPF